MDQVPQSCIATSFTACSGVELRQFDGQPMSVFTIDVQTHSIALVAKLRQPILPSLAGMPPVTSPPLDSGHPPLLESPAHPCYSPSMTHPNHLSPTTTAPAAAARRSSHFRRIPTLPSLNSCSIGFNQSRTNTTSSYETVQTRRNETDSGNSPPIGSPLGSPATRGRLRRSFPNDSARPFVLR